jgi:hypothetical protein
VYQRHWPLLLAGKPETIFANRYIGTAFLGNRFKDLHVRVTLSALKASTPLVPVTESFKLDDKGTQLFHAYSAAHDMVYATGEDTLYAFPVKAGTAGKPVKLEAPGAMAATRAIAVDDRRGLLYFARKDGVVEARALDAAGLPSATGEALPCGVQPNMLAVDVKTGMVYAAGSVLAGSVSHPRIVSVATDPYSRYTRGIAVDGEHGRLYVAGYRPGKGALAVWTLTADGTLASPEAKRYLDPFTLAGKDGVLTAVRVDGKRRKLYLAGVSSDLAAGD